MAPPARDIGLGQGRIVRFPVVVSIACKTIPGLCIFAGTQTRCPVRILGILSDWPGISEKIKRGHVLGCIICDLVCSYHSHM